MKTQLDLSSIVVAPEYRQKITILRDEGGTWYHGKYQHHRIVIETMGVISGTDERSTENTIPEGDRITETKDIHTIIPIYVARSYRIGSGQEEGFDADLIVWNGEKYKVVSVQNSGDYGYWKGTIAKLGTSDVAFGEIEEDTINYEDIEDGNEFEI